MELNLIHENSVNGLILPNCQTSEVFNYSKNWLIENNSNDMGLLTKSLFSKFGNDISVLGNGVIFQSMPQKGYSSKLNLTVNRILLDDILKDPNQYKNKTLFFGIEPFGHIDFFKNNLKKIDKNLFENLKKINAIIIINYSHEGHLTDFFIEEILKTISYKKIIFIYNDYLNNFEKYKSKNVTFLRYDYYINRSSRYFQYNLKENNIASLLDYENKKYHFLSFNQYPHHHRVKLIAELYKNNIINNFLISFNPKYYELLGSVKYDYENQLKDLGFWDDYLFFTSLSEQKVDFDTNFKISGYGFEDIRPYQKSCISLISDTIFFKKQGFISEKVFKPIMYLQPFLIVGPPFYLKELKKLGFKTFDGFIDESYDSELDDKLRLDKIINELKRICSLSIDELLIQVKKLENVLLYNQMRLLSFDYKSIEFDLTKRIIDEGHKFEKNIL